MLYMCIEMDQQNITIKPSCATEIEKEVAGKHTMQEWTINNGQTIYNKTLENHLVFISTNIVPQEKKMMISNKTKIEIW